MRRIGEVSARVFKMLAGLEKDEPIGAFVFALYGLLFLMAMSLVLVWLTGSAV